jgi:hypothetical protein
MQVLEGPWTEEFERHARTCWSFSKCPVYRMTAAGVSAVAAACKAEAAEAAMQPAQHSTFTNAPSPGADKAEWEAWLTSAHGPYDSGKFGVKFGMVVPEGQLRQLLRQWQKRNSALE